MAMRGAAVGYEFGDGGAVAVGEAGAVGKEEDAVSGQLLGGEIGVQGHVEDHLGAVEHFVGAVVVLLAQLVVVDPAGVLGELGGAEVPVHL